MWRVLAQQIGHPISEYSKLHIPIPPRKEQDRIINKVNELFQILDNINAEL